jgi:hypothetical protein
LGKDERAAFGSWEARLARAGTATTGEVEGGQGVGERFAPAQYKVGWAACPFSGDDMIHAMGEALAYAKGEGPARVNEDVVLHGVRQKARLTRGAEDAGDGERPVRLPQVRTGATKGRQTGSSHVARDPAGA